MKVVRGAVAALLVTLVGCGGESVPSPSPAARSDEPTRSEGAAPSDAPRADADRIRALLLELESIAEEHDGIRATGTAGYEASVELVAAKLSRIGFAVETPEVAYTSFRDAGSSLEVGGRTFAGPDEARALIYSPPGAVEGPVAILEGSGCDPDDFDDVPPGAVAVTLEGGCLRRDQALNASGAGIGALVVGYADRGPGEIFRPTLLDPAGIELPVVSVTGEAVEVLRASIGDEARVETRTELAPASFRNVVGQLGDGPRVVMVGAHLDSVFDGPGINDNGSGVAAALEIARAVVAEGVLDGWAVRIGLWGAEELGTIGSRAYAADLPPGEVVAYLNLDMAGSVNGETLVYDEPGAAPGSAAITRAYQVWLVANDEPYGTTDLGGSSDHIGFTLAGIPTGGLFAGATATGSASNPSSAPTGPDPDPCYHIGCDDADNVDVDRVALFAEATQAVVMELMREP